MYRVKPETTAFDVIVDAAESCSVSGIMRCTLLNPTQKQILLEKACNPVSLKGRARTRIRDLLGGYGPFVLEKVADLPIPGLLRQYLLFSAF